MIKSRACPDCPATRTRMLEVLVERPLGCALRCLSVAAREPLPMSWRSDYAIALVRRGIVVRQRVDAMGNATAIDVAGPGSAIPVPHSSDLSSSAYAADDAMLCLCPRSLVETCPTDIVLAQTRMLERIERLADARGRTHATSRVAALLLAIGDTLLGTGPTDVIPTSLRQRDLAALAALRHESICRELRTLTRRGLLERASSGLRIVDRAALALV